MKVVCIKMTSGEEIIGILVDKLNSMLSGSSQSSKYSGDGPWEPRGSICLERIRGITAQQVSKNEMGVVFFPWSLGNTDGVHEFMLDNCACSIYSPESNIEMGYIKQTSKLEIVHSIPNIKM